MYFIKMNKCGTIKWNKYQCSENGGNGDGFRFRRKKVEIDRCQVIISV